MKNNKNGVTLIALVITIIILIILAGVTVSYVIGDNGIVSNAMKMEVETAKGEVRDHMMLLLNEELVCASAVIAGTTEDIGTKFNEPSLINYLNGNPNFLDESGNPLDKGAIECIEEFENGNANGVKEITPKGGTGKIKSKYRIKSQALCPDGDKYGIGKNISDGNVFTLEAVVENVDTKEYEPYNDDSNKDRYQGKFKLSYYDKDGKEEVLDIVSLYTTNQS